MFKADVIYNKYHCNKDKGEGMKQSRGVWSGIIFFILTGR